MVGKTERHHMEYVQTTMGDEGCLLTEFVVDLRKS